MTQLIRFGSARPQVDPEAWIAPTATLIGSVTVRKMASIWYAAVLRADGDDILIGAGSNVQDGCVLHADPGLPVSIGERVSIGHRAVLHGCRIGDDTLIGMGAVVLNGAQVGEGCIVAAGAVILEGARVEAGTLVAGVPAKVRRALTRQERLGVVENAGSYVDLRRRHREALS